MWFSLALLSTGCLLYLIHFLFKIEDLPYNNPIPSLLGGVALVGMILSIACFCMNLGWIKMKKKKRPVWWMIISAIAFHLFIGYIVLIIIDKAHAAGIAF